MSLLALTVIVGSVGASASTPYDVVVYGGTSAGVAAAMQTARMGKRAVLIEPGKHLGGLTSGGLGATDIGNKAAIGGIAREFYHQILLHYQNPQAWTRQTFDEYRSQQKRVPDADAMWTFEPHVAEGVYRRWIGEAGVPVYFGQRLDLKAGVAREGKRIASIRMESGKQFFGRMFIDATYEGDLMAKAGVSYTVGREANSQYGETLNGVATARAIYHQFQQPVDPYRTPGEPASGLVALVQGDGPGTEGAADRRVQAYCFRMCMTDVPANRVPWPKPAAYDASQYELLARYFATGWKGPFWAPTPMPNRKTDTNNSGAFSTDAIGMNYNYPDGDYATRQRIIDQHEDYQKGLMWFLAHDPRVPQEVRQEVGRWGLAKDEFTDNGNWPHQLYVREARRMVSDYVMTEHHCVGKDSVPDPVGLGAYGMDSHNTQRYVDAEGLTRNEGDVEVGGFSPYGISYRSIVPKRGECENLLVPVCLSASHIAYGSIRMEPVFMVLGQSAATAAIQAIDGGRSVQEIDYQGLRERLLADRQVLHWQGPQRSPAVGLNAAGLGGVVVDNSAAVLRGGWSMAATVGPFVGTNYLHDGGTGQGLKTARFTAALAPGRYEVRLSYSANPNRATNVLVTVFHGAGQTELRINQKLPPPVDKAFISLGTFGFSSAAAAVEISNAGANGHVIADAVQFLPSGE